MRSRAVSWGGLLIGGLLAIVAAAQPWARAGTDGPTVSFSGIEATAGLAQALALVVLAGALLALVLRAVGRRVIAAILLLAGAGTVLLGLLHPQPSTDTVLARVRQITLGDSYTLSRTPWSWLYAAAGVLVLIGAVVMIWRAPTWPQRADRFQRNAELSRLADADPATLWKALDAGVDPTVAAAGDQDTQGNDAPIGGEVRSGDTMGLKKAKHSRPQERDKSD